MEEFALCWNNFQDNLTTGFQNLYNKNQMCDVTLACSGKLLKCHKLVLSICSPYFQEIFITNPCKHPIIILNVTYSVMEKLLQFMYQGEVNVKHTELQSFMKIAETLQIKGLTTSSQNKSQNSPNTSQLQQPFYQSHEEYDQQLQQNLLNNNNKLNSSINNNNVKQAVKLEALPQTSLKRTSDYLTHTEGYSGTITSSSSSTSSIYPKQKSKRLSTNEEHDQSLNNNDSMDNLAASDEVFLPPIPQISMMENSRFDLNNIKRESIDSSSESPSLNKMNSSNSLQRHTTPSAVFNFDYNNIYPNKSIEYPNELQLNNEFNKNTQHMDIPSGSNITMLSSTSLLNGNCVFNRNNTVATQQGMKTYWLCKSYRITMCRARCITHQGRILSATGVHNHQPHMKSPNQVSNVETKSISQTSPTTPATNTVCLKNMPSGGQLTQQGHHISVIPPSHLHHAPTHSNMEQQQQQQHQQDQQHHILNGEHQTSGNDGQHDTIVVHNMMQNVNILPQQQNILPIMSSVQLPSGQQIQVTSAGNMELTMNEQNLDTRTIHLQQHQPEQQQQYINIHQQHHNQQQMNQHHQQMNQNHLNNTNSLVTTASVDSINISNNNTIAIITSRPSTTPTTTNSSDNCNILHRTTATIATSSGA